MISETAKAAVGLSAITVKLEKDGPESLRAVLPDPERWTYEKRSEDPSLKLVTQWEWSYHPTKNGPRTIVITYRADGTLRYDDRRNRHRIVAEYVSNTIFSGCVFNVQTVPDSFVDFIDAIFYNIWKEGEA